MIYPKTLPRYTRTTHRQHYTDGSSEKWENGAEQGKFKVLPSVIFPSELNKKK